MSEPFANRQRPREAVRCPSDFPFREAAEAAEGMDAYGFSAADKESINRKRRGKEE